MIEFQSAHPVRGATFFGFRILPAPLFQSTRPVWGATDSTDRQLYIDMIFQSTRPVWGATEDVGNRIEEF